MSRQSRDNSTRSQQQQGGGRTTPTKSTRQQNASNSAAVQAARSRRQAEHQRKLELRADIKARFGANATQLKLTIYFILLVALVLTGIAFLSSNWLEVERRYYGSKFKKLGLWRMCFNSYSSPDDLSFKKFYVGCRWIFAEEYKPIRKYLLPGSCRYLFSSLLYLFCIALIQN